MATSSGRAHPASMCPAILKTVTLPGETEAQETFRHACSVLEDSSLPQISTFSRIKDRSKLGRAAAGDLAGSASSLLSPETRTVALLLGISSNCKFWPPTDTDGVGGGLALAAALFKLGKTVILVCDEVNHGQVYPALKESQAWKLHAEASSQKDTERLEYIQLPARATARLEDDKILKRIYYRADHIISVGRTGPGKEGECWSHELTCCSPWQSDDSFLFVWANEEKHTQNPPGANEQPVQTSTRKMTTALGCLGNELGMGKIAEAVKEAVGEGEWLACTIPADFVVVGSCVNFAAFALVIALGWGVQLFMEKKLAGESATLELLHKQAEVVEALLPTAWDQAAILKTLVAEGSRCSVTGTLDLIVCGRSFDALLSTLTEMARPLRQRTSCPAAKGNAHAYQIADCVFAALDEKKSAEHRAVAQRGDECEQRRLTSLVTP